MDAQVKSKAIKTHKACDSCGSSDALSFYEDGHTYCFSCEENIQPDRKGRDRKASKPDKLERVSFLTGSITDITDRGITKRVCQFYNYQTKQDQHNQTVHIVNVQNDRGQLVAQKIRYPNKQFALLGVLDNRFVGQHLRRSGTFIILTEGEIDMLTWGMATNIDNSNSRHHVVSIPSGAQHAKRCIAENLEYLSNFKQIYLSFDQDEHGQKATEECALLLADFELKIIKLPYKDANEVLLKGGLDQLQKCLYISEPYRPEKALKVKDIAAEILQPLKEGFKWFNKHLNKQTMGRQLASVYIITGGTGSGKTDYLTQQIAFDIDELNVKTALFSMEITPAELCKRIAGKLVKRHLHLPNLSRDDTAKLTDTICDFKFNDNLYLWDCFGTTDFKEIENAIKYYTSLGIQLYYIDNLTALATGKEKDERKELEHIMSRLAMLAKRYGIIFHVVSHLTSPMTGASHEEGAPVSVRHLKGSRTIGFWAHGILALERNQLSENAIDRNTLLCRVLKWRFLGSVTSHTFKHSYNSKEGYIYSL